jgi:hypothetical protein
VVGWGWCYLYTILDISAIVSPGGCHDDAATDVRTLQLAVDETGIQRIRQAPPTSAVG